MAVRRRRKKPGLALLTSAVSFAIVWPFSPSARAYDNHFDYTSFDNPNTPGANPHFGQNQFNVLNYPSITGNYMMTSTDAHRPDMVANGNNLAEFYNNFLADYNTQFNSAGGLNASAEADAITSYTNGHSTSNGPRPNFVILNEISSSVWQDTTQKGIDYRQWVVDVVTRLHDLYNFSIVTYAPFATVSTARASSWQAVAAKSYIGVENYLSGQEVMNGGSDYASRVAWAQAQYQASVDTYGAAGVPKSDLFLGEDFGQTASGSAFGRAGLSLSDWDTAVMIRQDAIYNVGFPGYLAYAWGSNPMGVAESDQIEAEYYYRSRLVLPSQQPQWLSDTAIPLTGASLSWGYALNWMGGVPNGANAVANFYKTLTAARTITLDGSRTVGTLTFNSPFSYTIDPGTGGTLTMNATAGTGAGIVVAQGSHMLTAPLAIASNTGIDIAGGSGLTFAGGISTTSASRTIMRTNTGTLTIAGTQSYAPNTLFNANGGTTNFNSDAGSNLTLNVNATVNLNATQHVGGVSISSGKLLTLSSGGAKKLSTGTLAITGGKLNLNDNDAIVHATPVGTFNGTSYTGLAGQIAAGRNGGAWNGTTGIVASASGSITGLGIASASDIGITSTALWNNESVTSTDALIMYTYVGDANLDGKINVDDYIRIDGGIASGLSGWSNGDFNYDGKVNIDDYTLLDANIGQQGPPLSGGSGIEGGALAAVPEPAAMTMLMLSAIPLTLRRRPRARMEGRR